MYSSTSCRSNVSGHCLVKHSGPRRVEKYDIVYLLITYVAPGI